ncbi:MAG: hypothetical protein JNK70_11580 [Phycisphaerae bacterium]|nr:hypothetical protein [Phycisphaerae bacterium]
MSMRFFVAFAAAPLVVFIANHRARAVDLVPAPEGGPVITELKLVSNKYELRDAATGRLLMQQRNAVPLATVVDARVTYSIQINPQPSGYDMVVTYTNPTSETLPAGAMYAGMFTLGPRIEYLDVRHTSVWREAEFSTFVGKGYSYPDDLFSPVFVMRSDEYAIGVSMRYPVVERNHDVRVMTMNPSGSNSGEQGPGWATGFRVSNPVNVHPSQALKHPAFIPPHSSRTFVLSLRVTRDREDWMRTLLPYYRYFRAMYGGVSYQRSTRPILPFGIADAYYQEAGNLDGYGDPATRRPDVFGWGPWTDRIIDIEGYSSVMLWASSGLYFFNPQFNYPFKVASRWEEKPLLSTAFDPAIGLPRVKDSGKTLGIWWGRSLDISPDWDPDHMIPIDPSNPAHVAIAERELAGFVRAGVELVGLDACNPAVTGIQNAYTWIARIRHRYPSITFLAEPSPCDVLSTLVGGVLPGWSLDGLPKTIDDCYPFRTPHYLADFLLPGHETVMSFRYNYHKDFFGVVPTDADVDRDVRWFAQLGFVPMVWRHVGTVGDVRASETWRWTVPASLRRELDAIDAQIKAGETAANESADPSARDLSPPLVGSKINK